MSADDELLRTIKESVNESENIALGVYGGTIPGAAANTHETLTLLRVIALITAELRT